MSASDGSEEQPEIVAYRIEAGRGLPVVPAEAGRAWMKATRSGFANRCLPLRIANQAGWFVLNERPFAVSWNGERGRSALTVRALDDGDDGGALRAVSVSGYGILSIHLPYLFRTSAGFNLLARGPANLPKDGIVALEGLVETDWSVATFTMNWQLTRPHLEVRFDVGEPICMIVPQRRGELDRFRASIRDIDDEPALAQEYRLFAANRAQRNAEVLKSVLEGTPAEAPPWERQYMRGNSPAGARATDHQTRLHLSPFAAGDGA